MSQVNRPGDFLPETFVVPEDDEAFRLFLTDYVLRASQSVNNRDISTYDVAIHPNGHRYFTPGDSNTFRSVYRLVVDFGALPNAATKTVAHSLGWTAAQPLVFTRIYGTATDTTAPGPALPLPYVNTTTPGDSVELQVTTTDVSITTTTANYTAFDTCYVVLEYIYERA